MTASRNVKRRRIVEEANGTFAVELLVGVFILIVAAFAEGGKSTVDNALTDKVLVVVFGTCVDAVWDETAFVDLG